MWSTMPARSGDDLLSDEDGVEVAERKRWQEWAKHAAEHERQRRIRVRCTRVCEPELHSGVFVGDPCLSHPSQLLTSAFFLALSTS